jgi:hypothetical protein
MVLTFEDDDVSDFLSLRLLIFIFIILFSEKENRDAREREIFLRLERFYRVGRSR